MSAERISWLSERIRGLYQEIQSPHDSEVANILEFMLEEIKELAGSCAKRGVTARSPLACANCGKHASCEWIEGMGWLLDTPCECGNTIYKVEAKNPEKWVGSYGTGA